jgi:GT2 family glycosyltransferase
MSRKEHLFFYNREQTNTGCVLARNEAIRKARGQFVWILDNDQFVSYRTLDRIKQTEGDLVGVEGWWINHQGLAERSSKVGAMNYVGAGGLFTKREVLMQLGRFDEQYSPAWFEDPDLCLKATEAGFSLGLCENSDIEHIGHATNHSQTDFDSAKIWKRNRDYFVKKWRKIFDAKPTVSIVILTHNDSDVTKRCIDRIYQTTDLKDIEIIVVENGSNQKEKDKIAEYQVRPNLKIHFADENLMVAKGRNLGSELATGDHILFLDNDMFLPEGWLSPLLQTLDENNVVATSPIVIDHRPDGQHVRFIATSIKDGHIYEHRNDKEKRECDFLPGGSLFVRADLFKRYPFDENFVFGVEDYDWCLSVRQAGFRFMNTPEVIFLHVKKGARTITPYDDAERKRKGSSFIEDSIRLFLYRHENQLPNQWKQPGWLGWAMGRENEPYIQSTIDFQCFLHEQVANRYPEEIKRGAN